MCDTTLYMQACEGLHLKSLFKFAQSHKITILHTFINTQNIAYIKNIFLAKAENPMLLPFSPLTLNILMTFHLYYAISSIDM